MVSGRDFRLHATLLLRPLSRKPGYTPVYISASLLALYEASLLLSSFLQISPNYLPSNQAAIMATGPGAVPSVPPMPFSPEQLAWLKASFVSHGREAPESEVPLSGSADAVGIAGGSGEASSSSTDPPTAGAPSSGE